MFAAVGKTSGISLLASAAPATTTAATAIPAAAHSSRALDHGDEANATSTSRYTRTRSNSRIARPGASDQPSESSDHAASRASAPAASANERLQPANGRSTTATRSASTTSSAAHTTPAVSAKYPPALNDAYNVRAAAPAADPTPSSRSRAPLWTAVAGAATPGRLARRESGPTYRSVRSTS